MLADPWVFTSSATFTSRRPDRYRGTPPKRTDAGASSHNMRLRPRVQVSGRAGTSARPESQTGRHRCLDSCECDRRRLKSASAAADSPTGLRQYASRQCRCCFLLCATHWPEVIASPLLRVTSRSGRTPTAIFWSLGQVFQCRLNYGASRSAR